MNFKLFNPIDYLYYKMFTFFCALDDDTMYGARNVTILLLLSNISLFFHFRSEDTILIVIIAMILYMLLSVYLMNCHKRIVMRYENESETCSDIGSTMVVLYSIGSIYAFIKLL